MSTVYLAEEIALERKVALKLLAPELERREIFLERFRRESRLAASLDHPNVIPVFDAGELDGLVCISMRRVEGPDLAQILLEERLAPQRAIEIATQVATALDAVHQHGLVHGDVKPSNVLVDASGLACLGDLGLTRCLQEAGRMEAALRGDGRLSRARADRGSRRRPSSRPVLARLPAVRVPRRRASLQARHGRRDELRPPRTRAAGPSGPRGRVPEGAREGSGQPLRIVLRAGGRCAEIARTADGRPGLT